MELAALIAAGGSFLLAVFGGAFLLSPAKGERGEVSRSKIFSSLRTFFLPVCMFLPAVLGLFLLSGEGSVARLWSGLLLCGGFFAAGRMDQLLSESRGKGLSGVQRFALFALTSLAAVLVLALSGEGIGALAVPFLGQVRLGVWTYPLLILLFSALGESFVSLGASDSLCCSYSFVCGAGVFACGVLLSLGGGQVFSGALAGGALGFALWSLSGGALSSGRQGTGLCAGFLAAASLLCGLPLLLLFFLPLPVLDRLFMWLGSGEEEGMPLSQRLSEKGVSSRSIMLLYFLAAFLGAVAAVAWVVVMYAG